LGLCENKPILFETKDIINEIKAVNHALGNSLSRLILSGELASKIRQDNFTKETGVWTNPLQKIITTSNIVKLVKKIKLEDKLISFSRELVLLEIINSQKAKDLALLPEKKTTFKLPKLNKITLNNNFSKKVNFRVLLGWLIIIFFSALTTYGLVFGIFYLQKHPLKISLPKVIFKSKTKPTPKAQEIIVRPTVAKKITPTVALERKKIIIEVQNGAGTAGLASQMKTLLEKKDYLVESTGNADSYKYQKTVIIAPSEAVFSLLYQDLKNNLSAKPTFEKTSEKKTTIIIGKDFSL
jgi:hypothetical protein